MSADSRQADQYMVRFPEGMRDMLKAAAKAAGRSLNAEIIHRIQAFDGREDEAEAMPTDDLVYTPPEAVAHSRRVYSLPVEMVKRIHAYGFENGHPSEVSAVRELLDMALRDHEQRKR